MEKCAACNRALRPLIEWHGAIKVCLQCRDRLIVLKVTQPDTFTLPPKQPVNVVKPQLSLF